MGVFSPWFSYLALEGGHQRAGFPADKGTTTPIYVNCEVEAGAQYVLAQQSVFHGLLDRYPGVPYRQGIFMADIYVALVRANGICSDDHPL
ncbi:hypothetical protein ES703_43032 [subsurface metagenome]